MVASTMILPCPPAHFPLTLCVSGTQEQTGIWKYMLGLTILFYIPTIRTSRVNSGRTLRRSLVFQMVDWANPTTGQITELTSNSNCTFPPSHCTLCSSRAEKSGCVADLTYTSYVTLLLYIFSKFLWNRGDRIFIYFYELSSKGFHNLKLCHLNSQVQTIVCSKAKYKDNSFYCSNARF